MVYGGTSRATRRIRIRYEGRCHDALWTSGVGGGPEVPTPTPADNEVLVRVRASSVCFGDRIFRSGPLLIRLLSGFRPRHPILGVDLAGTVEKVGPGVTRFAPGDAVYGARGDKFAAHAEFACVAEDGFIARKPATMTFEEAGTVFVGAACSLYFLRRANVKPGERVLVHGASGSLGVFAVQLAKHFGAHVTACAAAPTSTSCARSGPTRGSMTRRRTSPMAAGPTT